MTNTAFAPVVDFKRFGGTVHAYDPSGAKIGQIDMIHGFAHYYGTKGSVHEGVTAIVRGGIDGVTAALTTGLRSGRDDRIR